VTAREALERALELLDGVPTVQPSADWRPLLVRALGWSEDTIRPIARAVIRAVEGWRDGDALLTVGRVLRDGTGSGWLAEEAGQPGHLVRWIELQPSRLGQTLGQPRVRVQIERHLIRVGRVDARSGTVEWME
jgi:hypothetical protein